MDFDFSPNFNIYPTMVYDQAYDRRHPKQKVTGKQRQAANERERKRMNSINQGFNSLRGRLPSGNCDKKLSKVDTLRHAMKYIQHLKSILEQNENNSSEDMNIPSNAQQTILIEDNEPENPPSIYRISWKKKPEEYGGIHESPMGPVVFQKDVWCPTGNSSSNDETNF